ncbi:HDOD domain-containing protein [Thiomicrorhabdus sp.]|uniref:HDOD domain-containing protein n=1 Tax=Thiomicrorhabdus sp. TaxID=2039724 RepID=UPI0029C708B8|nr:HDOD domain-containing protein [Thiomicrorhabdus sp.]
MKTDIKTGMHNAGEILKSIETKSLPIEVFELEEAMQAETPNMVEIANIISKHPELLGEFLAITNRVLRREEEDLIFDARAAVNLLGLQEIRQLFLMSYLQKNLPKDDSGRKLIMRSKRAAIAASELSYWINELPRCETYLAAFLQDIGALYLSQFDDEYIATFLNTQLTEPFMAYDRELNHYQTAHTYLGSLISRKWHLGDLLCKSILLHHTKQLESLTEYDARVASMVALIQLSNGLVFREFSDHYETPELKESIAHAISYLQLPEKATAAATASLKKWGPNCCEHIASH